MSSVNIRGAVDNIRGNTTVHTPVVELIVNAIQAIDETGRQDSHVRIRVHRSTQLERDNSLPAITGFVIEDNGIGFTRTHRESFDTLYSDLKITEGGKGFGRFLCLKYFSDLRVESVCREGEDFRACRFSMGKGQDIIVDLAVTDTDRTQTGSSVTLADLKAGLSFDRRLSTVARQLVERLLPCFIAQGYACPRIELCEADGSGRILLNGLIGSDPSAVIQEIAEQGRTFQLGTDADPEEFRVRVFKLHAPRGQKSRVSLVAHKREVSGQAIQKYVPEFEEDFQEKEGDASDRARTYIVKAYVSGRYLDRHVSLERTGFQFAMDNDLLLGIAQSEIEREAASIAKAAVGADITVRQARKRERWQSYVDSDAPWHKSTLKAMDLSALPYSPTPEEMESWLHRHKFAREVAVRREVTQLLARTTLEGAQASAAEVVKTIAQSSKDELIHYVVLRRQILDVLGKSLEANASGTYALEGLVHDILFPRQGDTEVTEFQEHNLWILDERLNYTSYVCSDLPLDGRDSGRPDLLVYNRRVLFRGDNEASNPIAIFEFKRPQREDLTDPSREDPLHQIVRYVNAIRDGRYRTPEGRPMRVTDNTPFYGYVICDLTSKVAEWLRREKNFTPLPDQLGWFHWMGNNNLYLDVVSWDKLLKDARMRNRVFFQKLGIQ